MTCEGLMANGSLKIEHLSRWDKTGNWCGAQSSQCWWMTTVLLIQMQLVSLHQLQLCDMSSFRLSVTHRLSQPPLNSHGSCHRPCARANPTFPAHPTGKTCCRLNDRLLASKMSIKHNRIMIVLLPLAHLFFPHVILRVTRLLNAMHWVMRSPHSRSDAPEPEPLSAFFLPHLSYFSLWVEALKQKLRLDCSGVWSAAGVKDSGAPR